MIQYCGDSLCSLLNKEIRCCEINDVNKYKMLILFQPVSFLYSKMSLFITKSLSINTNWLAAVSVWMSREPITALFVLIDRWDVREKCEINSNFRKINNFTVVHILYFHSFNNLLHNFTSYLYKTWKTSRQLL